MKTWLKFLSRNPFYTGVEVVGLSVAIGFVILLLSYSIGQYRIGRNNPRATEIYVVGNAEAIGMTRGTIPTFAPELPQITSYAVVEPSYQRVGEDGQQAYNALGALADSCFFDFFPYALHGLSKAQALRSRDGVLLCESLARRVFSDKDPIGQTLKIGSEDFTVEGTYDDFSPSDVSYKLEFLITLDHSESAYMDNFGNSVTFITLSPGTAPDEVAVALLEKYVTYWSDFYGRDSSGGAFIYGSTLTRMDRIYFSPLAKYTMLRSGNLRQMLLLLLVAVVLLVCAIFNYVNLSVAQTEKRAKEMAMRRLLGSSRGEIVGRYLAESFLFTAACFALGMVVAELFRPLLSELIGNDIQLLTDAWSLVYFVLLVLAVSLVNGIIPAALVSKFSPMDVVRGFYIFSSRKYLSKVFVIFQNVISTVMVAVSLAMFAQIRYVESFDVGYRTKDLIFIDTWNMPDPLLLRDRLLALPQVKAVSVCSQLPTQCGFNGVVNDTGSHDYISMPAVDTLGFRLLGFKVVDKYTDPLPGQVWVTESTAAHFGVSREHPLLGYNGGAQYEVCGVVKDFTTQSALYDRSKYGEYSAVSMFSPKDPRFIGALVPEYEGDVEQVKDLLRKVTEEVNQEVTGRKEALPCGTLGAYIEGTLKDVKNAALLVLIFMIVSIVVSALGLVAMSGYYAGAEGRGVAVRKVFGAEGREEVRRLCLSFMTMSMWAALISAPISVYVIGRYLETMYRRIPFPWHLVAMALLLSLAVALLSILAQALMASRTNPVEELKKE